MASCLIMCTDGICPAQIHLQPFPGALLGTPAGLDIFICSPSGLMPGGIRGGGAGLLVGKQHPFWTDGKRVKFSIRNIQRVIAEALAAEQNAVPVKTCREDAYAFLKVGVDGDAHGCGMPEVAVPVLDGAAVACAGDKPARLAGIGVMCLVGKGTQG